MVEFGWSDIEQLHRDCGAIFWRGGRQIKGCLMYPFQHTVQGDAQLACPSRVHWASSPMPFMTRFSFSGGVEAGESEEKTMEDTRPKWRTINVQRWGNEWPQHYVALAL